jgi:hypothetical protein
MAASASRCPRAHWPARRGSHTCVQSSPAWSCAPLLVHPGPAAATVAGEASLGDPLWWPALTRYVAEMHAAWLAFVSAGRLEHPELRIVFTMLAGLAPLHAERLASRGGPTFEGLDPDPLLFYDTSSYGPAAVGALADAIGGAGQLLYGSDRPVVEPALLDRPELLDWDLLADGAARVFGTVPALAEALR